MPGVRHVLTPEYIWGKLPVLTGTGLITIPLLGRTFTAANPFGALGNGEQSSIVGGAIAPVCSPFTITGIYARLNAALTGGGGSSIDVGVYDFDTAGQIASVNLAVGQQVNSATGLEVAVDEPQRICLHVARNGTPASSVVFTGITITYRTLLTDGFINFMKDGTVTGSSFTRYWASFPNGDIDSNDGIVSPWNSGQKAGYFPEITTIHRGGIQNSIVPTSNFQWQLRQGAANAGGTLDIASGNPANVRGDLGVTYARLNDVSELNTIYSTLRGTAAGSGSMLPNLCVSYGIDNFPARSWYMLGWGSRLTAAATNYDVFNGNTSTTSQINAQVPWGLSGTIKGLIAVILPQNTSDDKTYELHLEKAGSSVDSISFTNDAAEIVVRDNSFTVPVAAGDLLNWRLQMNGGFTASRGITIMAVVGFDPS